MTQVADFNNGGARQDIDYVTIVIDADEFSGVSATASTLDLCVIPPGAIPIVVVPTVETIFNGGGTDTLSLNVGSSALFTGTSDNLAALGAAAGTLGVGATKQTAEATVKAIYTPSTSAASTGSVRVNIGYLIADRACDVYGE